MGKLVYTMLISLDGYFQDRNGCFDWAEPKQDLHEYFNKMEASSELVLYGRKMYKVMTFWETVDDQEKYPEYIKDYAKIWKRKQKIVFSRTLDRVSTTKTILKNDFSQSELLGIKTSTNGIISIGGAEIASTAIKMNLVDEIYAFIFPVLIGGGRKWLDVDAVKILNLIETKQFDDGVLMVHYATKID
jgi:dihydrofolate reductase